MAANFTWTKPKERAAKLLAEDELTDDAIAQEVGISPAGLALWKKHPDFQARMQQHVDAFRARIFRTGFARKEKRIEALDLTARDLLKQLVAEEYDREEVRIAANGEHVSFKLHDHTRYASFRGALDDIAKELGERKTNVELAGKDGAPLQPLVTVYIPDNGRDRDD